MKICRSWMFVPGHIDKMVRKALASQADGLMLDIEDGVLPAFKAQARTVIAAALADTPASDQARFVRTNAISLPDFKADIDAIVGSNAAGLVLAKVEAPAEIAEAVVLIEKLEKERGAGTKLQLIPAIESAKGVLAAPAIAAASPRVVGLMLGAEDLARDIGLPARRTQEAHELVYARSALVFAATSARIQSIDQVWPDLGDTDGLTADAGQARRLGFTGKAIIHPSQIDPVNTAFSPSAADIDFAERVVAAFKDAEAKGLGAVAFGGQLLDKPIVDRARAVLAFHSGH
jgi:citrate lyase subunit beta/citryl-CoA lyase